MNDIKTLIIKDCQSVSNLNNLPQDLENLIIISLTASEQELKNINLPITLKTIIIGNISNKLIFQNSDNGIISYFNDCITNDTFIAKYIKLPFGCSLIYGIKHFQPSGKPIFSFKYINNFHNFLFGTYWANIKQSELYYKSYTIHFNEIDSDYYFYIN